MRGSALSSSVLEAALTEEIATALLENLRRGARHWRSYLTNYWEAPDDIQLLWSEELGKINPDVTLCSVEIVSNFDGIPGVEGDVAYHDVDSFGRPRCRISWAAVQAQGGTLTGPNGLTVAISHELLETLIDPLCVRTVTTTFGGLNPNGKDEPLEVCDRIQGSDYCEPTSPNVFVANMTTPAYWMGAGQVDTRADVEASPVVTPWQQLATGYHEELGPNGESNLVFGARVSDFNIVRLVRQGPRGGKRWNR